LWSALSQLWPLALIVLGLDLLIPRRSVLGSVLVAVLLLAVVVAGAGLAMPAISAPPSTVSGERIAIPASGDAQAEISLGPGAGSVWVDSLAAGEALMTGTIRVPNGTVDQLVETAGDTTTVTLKSAGVVPVPVYFGNREVWNLEISPDPALALSVHLGAGEMHLDAARLNVDSLDVSLGAGQVEVALPEGRSTATLSTAIGQIVIRVPEGTPVSLRASTVGGAVQVPPGYRKAGATYLSPGFVAGDHIEIDASVVFGQISIIEP
jgi:hypothetical protein